MASKDTRTGESAPPASKKSQRSNIFGDACPREVVLSQRTGKAEKDILAEEAMHEKLHLRLSPHQLAEKQSLEAFIAEMEASLKTATDAPTRDALTQEISRQKLKLESLIQHFEAEAIERAKYGGGVRPSERLNRGRSFDTPTTEDPFHDDYDHRQGQMSDGVREGVEIRVRHEGGHPPGRRYSSSSHDEMYRRSGRHPRDAETGHRESGSSEFPRRF